MINAADIAEAHRAQLEREAAATNERAGDSTPEAGSLTARLRRDMVLTSGKYYVTDDKK
jgi:hypothetical protein